MYTNLDKPDNLHIYTHHKKISTSLTFYEKLSWMREVVFNSSISAAT
jgi:hypothetical protein